jgi:hypothetical protein
MTAITPPGKPTVGHCMLGRSHLIGKLNGSNMRFSRIFDLMKSHIFAKGRQLKVPSWRNKRQFLHSKRQVGGNSAVYFDVIIE